MKIYIIVFLVLLISNNIYALFNIEGTIKDAVSNENLIGATIYIPDLKIGAISDTNGYFAIYNLKKASYLIVINYIGYKTISKRIDLHSDTVLSIKLSPAITELGEIVVTGVTQATELKQSPITVATIDLNTIQENNSSNIIDALKIIPGINQLSSGQNISKPIIRGLGYNRIITLNNGIKLEGQQWGDEHGIEIDEFAIDRVEIIKGPGSLLYGSDGIAGVINFLPPKPIINDKIESQFILNYQSNNNLIAYSLSNEGNKYGLQWLARFTNKYAGNYKNNYDGLVYNSGYQEYDGNISIGTINNWGYSYLNINSYNTKLGIIEGLRDSIGNFAYENKEGNKITVPNNELQGYNIGTPFQWVNHLSLTSNSLLVLRKGNINLDFGIQINNRKEFEEIEYPNIAGLALQLNTLNYNIRYNCNKIAGWETSLGIGGMYQKNINRGIEYLIPDYNLFDYGIFIYTQKTFNLLTISGGLRYDNRLLNVDGLYLNQSGMPITNIDSNSITKFTQFNRYYNGLSGSLGATYQLSDYSTIKLNISNGYRTPNIAELASNGVHEGVFRYEIGNSNLNPEYSHQIDLSYSYNTDNIIFEITPFINYINNYIFIEKLKDNNGNDIIIDSNTAYPTFSYISGNAMLWGGEIYCDIHLHNIDWLHIENTFSYVQSILTNQSDSTTFLPFTPAPHYRGGWKAQFNNWIIDIPSVYIKFNIDYYFAQNQIFSAYQTESATPDYTLLSAGIGANINLSNNSSINIYLSGNNLANITYQNHLNKLKYAPQNPLTKRMGIFDMGRNFSIKLIYNM